MGLEVELSWPPLGPWRTGLWALASLAGAKTVGGLVRPDGPSVCRLRRMPIKFDGHSAMEAPLLGTLSVPDARRVAESLEELTVETDGTSGPPVSGQR